jgi:hypothetical protein
LVSWHVGFTGVEDCAFQNLNILTLSVPN